MFDLLRIGRSKRANNPRNVARQRVQAAIRRDRLEVSTPQLSALRVNLLTTISEHLPVAPDFAEFRLHRDGDDVFLVSRVRLREHR
jgi:septum formation topological specificity factor MinE